MKISEKISQIALRHKLWKQKTQKPDPSQNSFHFRPHIPAGTMHAISLLQAAAEIELVLEPQSLYVKPLQLWAANPPNIWSAPIIPTVWKIGSRHADHSAPIKIIMPRAHTFGIRHVITNNMGLKNYGMVLKYPLSKSISTLTPLRQIHNMLKRHLSKTCVFTMVMPETTRALVTQINLEAPNTSNESKRKVFISRAAKKVETCFGTDASFRVYTDCNIIVFGSIDVPLEVATEELIENFSGKGDRPYVCLADVTVGLYAILVSPDEAHVSIDIRLEHISHGLNIHGY